jgi:anaerobic magnesium-protoporphyrin IX monomethyl ester cyclase
MGPAITFVFPRIDNGIFFRGFDFHLGAAYVRAHLEQEGFVSRQYINLGKLTVNDAAAGILEGDPAAVGFSCYDSNLYVCALVARAIKRRAPSMPILIGGPSATFSSEKILMRHPEFDIAVRSYGEETAAELCNMLPNLIDLSTIDGITWRTSSGEVCRNTDRILPKRGSNGEAPTVPKALDQFPDPYLTGAIPFSRLPDIGTITSRGCSFPCTFCNFAAMSARKVREHSIERVLDILDAASRWAHSEIPGRSLRVSINDDNFSINVRRMRWLLQEIERRRYENLHLWAEMRVDALQASDFALMARAGLREINIGLDTASERVVRSAKKIAIGRNGGGSFVRERQYISSIAAAVRSAQTEGIDVCLSIILGLPGEELQDGQKTLDFVSGLGLQRYAHNIIQVFDGTELAQTAASFGIKVRPFPGRALPNITEPAYPVLNLPLLKGDESQSPNRTLLTTQAHALLTGHWGTAEINPVRSYGRGGQGTTAASHDDTLLVLANPRAFGKARGRLLARALPLNTLVWIEERTRASRDKVRHDISAAELPVQDVNFVEISRSEGPHEAALAINRPGFSFGGHPLAEVRAGSRSSSSPSPGRDGKIRPRMLWLNTSSEVEGFRRLMEESATSQGWRFSAEFLSHPVVIADACRWSARACPAAALKRLFVRRDATAAPCIDHPGVSTSGLGSHQDLIQGFKSELESAATRRNCDECPAASSCSRCFVTSGLGDAYCDIKRRNYGLTAFVDALLAIQTLQLRSIIHTGASVEVIDLQRARAGGQVRLGPTLLPLQDCMLIIISDQPRAVVCAPKQSLFAGIAEQDARILAKVLI